MVLLCTDPFIVTLSLSQNDLNIVERDVKQQNYHHFSNFDIFSSVQVPINSYLYILFVQQFLEKNLLSNLLRFQTHLFIHIVCPTISGNV